MIIGVVSGLICALSVFAYIQNVKTESDTARTEALVRYGGEQLEVCIATRDIAPGEKVDSGNVSTKLWVADLLPENAVRSFSDVSGKRATSIILGGEVISTKRFEATETQMEIPEGLSAISLPAKTVQAVGGAITQGMHVDVYATGNSTTTLLARDVLVLSTSSEGSTSKSNSSTAWVTLAVESRFVQELIAASQKSEIYFVLPSSDKKG